MDLSAVKAICDGALPSMRDALWANDVLIINEFGTCSNPDWKASCSRNPPYRRATITIDPAKADDEADVLESLRHEVLHLVLGEMDIYAELVQTNIEDDGPAKAAEEVMWRVCIERTVNRLEQVLDGLGWTSAAISGRPTTCSACSNTWRALAPEGSTYAVCPSCKERVTMGREG